MNNAGLISITSQNYQTRQINRTKLISEKTRQGKTYGLGTIQTRRRNAGHIGGVILTPPTTPVNMPWAVIHRRSYLAISHQVQTSRYHHLSPSNSILHRVRMRRSGIIEQLKKDEGFSQYLYDCPAGKKTIGYGWNVEDIGISHDCAEYVLERLVDDCTEDLYYSFPWFKNMPDQVQEVLVNMCYNLGINRLKLFKKALAAFSKRDWQAAAVEMKDSRWFGQVGKRAQRLVSIIEQIND